MSEHACSRWPPELSARGCPTNSSNERSRCRRSPQAQRCREPPPTGCPAGPLPALLCLTGAARGPRPPRRCAPGPYFRGEGCDEVCKAYLGAKLASARRARCPTSPTQAPQNSSQGARGAQARRGALISNTPRGMAAVLDGTAPDRPTTPPPRRCRVRRGARVSREDLLRKISLELRHRRTVPDRLSQSQEQEHAALFDDEERERVGKPTRPNSRPAEYRQIRKYRPQAIEEQNANWRLRTCP